MPPRKYVLFLFPEGCQHQTSAKYVFWSALGLLFGKLPTAKIAGTLVVSCEKDGGKEGGSTSRTWDSLFELHLDVFCCLFLFTQIHQLNHRFV